MSMSNASETALMNLLFNNVAYANLGDASGVQPSAAAGSLFISLHSADPGEAGNQSTSEISYTGYARVGVARTPAGFSVSGATVSNVAQVLFGAVTAGTGSATHFSIGLLTSGAGQILVSGPLNITLNFQPGTTPLFQAGQLTATAD